MIEEIWLNIQADFNKSPVLVDILTLATAFLIPSLLATWYVLYTDAKEETKKTKSAFLYL